MIDSAHRQWGVRLAGIAAVLLFLVLVARFWHPVYGLTAFFQLDAGNDKLKIAEFHELPVYVWRDTGGYDGLYYAQIAQDPTLRHPELPRAMDNLSYRARRILPPALAWLLGAGQPAGIVLAYSLLNVGAWFLFAAMLWRLFGVASLRGWIAWAGLLFSAGVLSSVRLALTDLIALTLIAASLAAAEHARGRIAVVLLGAANLARETSLLAGFGLCQSPWVSRRNFLRLALATAPLIAWFAYNRGRAGPADQGWANFTFPVMGLIEKAGASLHAAFHLEDRLLAWTTLLALVALVVQAAFILVRRRPDDPWWRLGAAYGLLLLTLGTAVWEGFPGAATRVLLPLNLAFNVLALRSQVNLAWLVAGNLSVFSGLLALRDVPQDRLELAAARQGAAACVARFNDTWYDREQDRRHTWLWAREQGRLDLEIWPRTGTPVRLEFGLRSLSPRVVTLEHEGRELWRAAVGVLSETHQVVVPASGGMTTLVFRSDTPPLPEATTPGARELGFALYDLRVALPASEP